MAWSNVFPKDEGYVIFKKLPHQKFFLPPLSSAIDPLFLIFLIFIWLFWLYLSLPFIFVFLISNFVTIIINLFFFSINPITTAVYVILLIKVSSPFIVVVVSIFIIYLFLIDFFFTVISIYLSATYQLFIFLRLLFVILVFSLFVQEFYAFFNP